MKSKHHITVAVEGNIGSGKSTFMEHFIRFDEADVLFEPVYQWRNLAGKHNLLQMMYESPERHSLTFQSYVQLTMSKLHLQKPSASNKIMKCMERSLFSARHCFVENLYRNGSLNSAEYGLLCEWYEYLVSLLDFGVDLIVYLRTSPEVAWERVKSRSRPEETIVPFEYLRQLHALHEDWLLCRCSTNSNLPAPVLVIEADQALSANPTLYSDAVQQIRQRFNLTGDHRHLTSARLTPKKPTPSDLGVAIL